MNKEQLAALLNGRSYRNEITKEEEKLAKENNLLVIFGASDDLVEFRGAIYDETGAYEGCQILLAKKGDTFEWEDEELEETVTRTAKKTSFYDLNPDNDYSDRKNVVEVVWCPEGLINFNGKESEPSWIYKTKIPHSTFIIEEDGDVYCQGIVIDINDL